MHQNTLDDVDIRQIKLVSGDDIIAFVQGASEEGLWLETPLQVSFDLHSADARQSYYFVRWMTFVDDHHVIHIKEDQILSSAPCYEEMKLRYIKTVTNFNQAAMDTAVDMAMDEQYEDEPENPSDFSDTDTPKVYH